MGQGRKQGGKDGRENETEGGAGERLATAMARGRAMPRVRGGCERGRVRRRD